MYSLTSAYAQISTFYLQTKMYIELNDYDNY